MNNKDNLLITFKVKNKTGVLSFLMLTGGKLGLTYKKKFERRIDDDTRQVLIYYRGISNISFDDTVRAFRKHPGVIEVEDIAFVDSDDMRSKPRPDVVSEKLKANDIAETA